METRKDDRDRFRLTVPRKVRVWLIAGGLLLGFLAGLYTVGPLEEVLDLSLSSVERIGVVGLFGLIGAPLLAFVGPLVADLLIAVGWWIERRLLRIPVGDIVAGVSGLIFGLIIANLIGSALGQLPWVGRFVPAVTAVILGSVGWVVAVKKKQDVVAWVRASKVSDFFSRSDSGATESKGGDSRDVPKVLDSSSIIDGRIADVTKTGFLDGPLVIPSFVLDEVQRIADSSDGVRRSRGRRGLDILNRMQKEMDVVVRVERMDFDEETPVDSRLLEAARRLDGKVVTNDYNLNKVAALQGVPVLNINDLANAVKPMVIPGEEMDIFLLREGKEQGQGVGYLDDGTMVVVDEGISHVGESLTVVVTSVLQTSAGRMIFARPRKIANAVT